MKIQPNLFRVLLKHSSKPYDNKQVGKRLVLLHKHRNLTPALRGQYIYELFCFTSNITIKAINNFNNLTKNVPESKMVHTEEDIVNECYIGLDRCVKNMKFDKYREFHFYYNSCLNKIIYRLYEKYYEKHFSVVENTDNVIIKAENYHRKSEFLVDFTDVDIEGMNLTDAEREILKVKMEGSEFQPLLKRLKMMPAQYKKCVESLKLKLIEFYNLDPKRFV